MSLRTILSRILPATAFVCLAACAATAAPPTLSEVAQPFERPEGSPAYSDVCISPRWTTRGNRALQAIKGFNANWILWCYMRPNYKEFIPRTKDYGIEFFGSAVNSGLPDEPFVERTYEKGRLKTVEGKPTAPAHAIPWKSWTGCCNSPEYRDIYLNYAFMAIDAGANAMHMDGPAMNYVLGGCHCEHCMAKFTPWLAEHTTPEQRAEWDIESLEGFDFRQYRLARPKYEAPKDLMDLFFDFQHESVVQFYRDMRAAFDERAGRRVPFSANTRDWDPPMDVFDFAIAELRETHSSPRALYEEVHEAREHGKTTVRTLQSTSTLLNRQVLASSYAIGSHMLCPWDVYTYTGVPRLMGDPKDYNDLTGFIRRHPELFDGYEDAAINGMRCEDARHPNAAPVFVEDRDVFVSVRARPGDSEAPVVIHLIDWRDEPQPFRVCLDVRRFFPERPVKVHLERPAAQPLLIAEGAANSFQIPALGPWGVLVVEPASGAAPVWPPVIASPAEGSFLDNTRVALEAIAPTDVIRYTTDGSEPTARSPIYEGPIALSETTTIKARAFGDGIGPSEVLESRFERIETVEPVEPQDIAGDGLLCRYWEAAYSRTPAFEDLVAGLSPKKAEPIIFPHLGMRDRDGQFAMEFVGWLRAGEAGDYTFSARCAGDCEVFVGGRKAFSNVGVGKMRALGVPGTPVTLGAGLHPFRVTYVARGNDNRGLRVHYEGPDVTFRRIPESALRRPAP